MMVYPSARVKGKIFVLPHFNQQAAALPPVREVGLVGINGKSDCRGVE
jgi:hypothetical protein